MRLILAWWVTNKQFPSVWFCVVEARAKAMHEVLIYRTEEKAVRCSFRMQQHSNKHCRRQRVPESSLPVCSLHVLHLNRRRVSKSSRRCGRWHGRTISARGPKVVVHQTRHDRRVNKHLHIRQTLRSSFRSPASWISSGGNKKKKRSSC